jgi:uncharacterized protein (DUF2236 family)
MHTIKPLRKNSMEKPFVHVDSVVRKIWGDSDTILFIFAGASAEFALNKAVDWLYFTGKLPSDPLGRLFTTVSYARKIVFASEVEALKNIDTITHIHQSVEKNRGSTIPDWAYRDVLYMLIYYSIASYELLHRTMNDAEKEDVYNVFYRVGTRMGLRELPHDFKKWKLSREQHLMNDLQYSRYTQNLFAQYKKHLGAVRFKLLIEGQKLIIPSRVRQLLAMSRHSLLMPIIPIYKIAKRIKLDWMLKNILLPGAYKNQINELNIRTGQ